MKNQKIILIVILILNSVSFLSSEEPIKEYIVLSNNVDIHDGPAQNSNVVRRTSFPDILAVYEIAGSGTFNNGVFDKWARISEERAEWINYYYISSFPFVISANDGYNSDPYDYNTMIVDGYYYWNNSSRLFFNLRRNFSGIFNYTNREYQLAVKPLIEGVSVIDNPWTRLYNFCDDFQAYVRKIDNRLVGWRIIIENEVILDYGIHVGMDIRDIEEIFGYGYERRENIYHYQAVYVGYGSEIDFYVENNRVTKIVYSMIK